MQIRRRFRSPLWRVPIEQEVREEIAHHVDLRTQELVHRGVPPDEARAEAERRFGDRVRTEMTRLGHERNRAWARRDWFTELAQDVRFAVRLTRTMPGFTAAAVLTLALGLGATTSIFSVLHAVVLAPFPYSDPERVLLVFTTSHGSPTNVSAGNFDYIRRRATTFEYLAAQQYDSFNLTGAGEPERLQGTRVTWDYFPVFGIPPLLGRTFVPDEDRPGRTGVVVLSEGLWRRRFGADPAIVGSQIRLNGLPHDVIGVMPSRFDAEVGAEELWLPIGFTPERLAMYDEHYLNLFGRRRADVTLAQVNDELSRVAASLAADHRQFSREWGAEAVELRSFVVGDYRRRLFVLLAAVTLVLLIACGNVANLMLARLAARSRELAIRTAIGAGRGRLVRQVLTESLLIAGLGGVAGVALAWWAIPALVALAPAAVPRLESASLNPVVLFAAAGLVGVSGLLVGLLPAWQASGRANLHQGLDEGKGTVGRGVRPRVRQVLIGGQAALVLVVVSAATLLVQTAINLQRVELGLRTEGVLAARVALPAAQYATSDQAREAFNQIVARVATSPGVTAAALDPQPPLLARGMSNGLVPEGRLTSDPIVSQTHFITPAYFATLGIPLKSGRSFTDADTRHAPLVMVINETLARAAYGDDDPIGKRMMCCEGSPGNPMHKTVVGVVADTRSWGPAEPTRPEFYLPMAQIPDAAWSWIGRTMHIVTRGTDSALQTAAIKAGVRQLDPSLPIFAIRTLDEGRRQYLAQSRFNTTLMTALGAVGLLLAALGIYSVIAWLAAERRREIGVRIALGASVSDVVAVMASHGLKPIVAGLVLGVAGAIASTGVLRTELFGVAPRDPTTLLASALVLLIVGAVAALVPAWRTARMDPSRALRE
jgi:predicted permease